MFSSTHKRAFIEKLIISSRNQENSLKMQKLLYAFLLQDTLNGKLYKYRSFDKNGYSLKILCIVQILQFLTIRLTVKSVLPLVLYTKRSMKTNLI